MTPTLIMLLGIVFGVCFLIWLGMRLNPKPFPPYSEENISPETLPLPSDLPKTVE